MGASCKRPEIYNVILSYGREEFWQSVVSFIFWLFGLHFTVEARKTLLRSMSLPIFLSAYVACMLSVGIASTVFAREVDSLEDAIRLKGFSEQLQDEAKAEAERLSDKSQVKVEEASWEKQKHQALAEYEVAKRHQARVVGEDGPDYQVYIQERQQDRKQHSLYRYYFVNERDQRRRLERSEIHLTEATEFGLDANEPRVDWKLRRFGETAHSSTSSASTSFSQPTWEAPPPPPPPMYEQPYYEEMMPPPPPPPLFDDESPF
jgi:hypothetical protein